MEKIPFENLPSTDTPISAENLNLLQDNVEQEINLTKGTILYENASGTNATSITMSENLANYKSVEVVYGFENLRKIVKAPKGGALPLFLSRAGYFQDSYYGVRQNTTSISFNGNIATKPIGYTFSYKTDGTMVFSDAINGIYIYKIVGYKE